MLSATAAFANPVDGIVSAGSATITQSGNTLEITQGSNKAVIDWGSFNIAAGETTRFVQPSSSAVVLNRVNVSNPSQIFGHLDANGNVIIVNPSGVLFGAGSRIDVNSLVATTAGISNQAFMASGPWSFDQAGDPTASVVNEGSITAAQAGLVGLVAPNVINSGTITARLGTVQLSSADTFVMDMYGDGLMSFAVSSAVQKQLVQNEGRISAAGGTIAMTAAAGNSIVNSLIKADGELSAPAVAERGGKIYIYAAGSNAVADNVASGKGSLSGSSTVLVGGMLDVSGIGAGQKGGDISVLGDNVGLLGGAALNANGDAGGGYVRIGGDFHGAGPTPTALYTYIDSDASIFANALTAGNGGNVAIWSDGMTEFTGTIFARGGMQAGDGGYVETSGEQTLYFRNGAIVDTMAVNGIDGTLLLDPAALTIMAGSGDGAADGTNTFKGASTVGTIARGNALATVYQSELEGIAATTNISLAATGAITLNDLGGGTLNLAQTAGHSVTFSAGTTFTMANTADTIATAGGAVNITTGTGSSSIGNLSTGGGLITINTTGATTVSGVINNTGGLTKSGTGTLYLSGNNTYSGTTTLSAGTLALTNNNALGSSTLSLSSGATLDLVSDTAMTLNNSTTLTASSTVKSSRVTSGAGVTNTLGTLSQGTFALTVNKGSNVTSGTAGVAFGATTFTGNPTFTVGSGAALTLGALTDGGTARTITSNGLGTLVFGSAASSWAAADILTITGGTVQLGATNALGTGTTTAVNLSDITTSGTALFDLNGYNQGILSLTFNGGISVNNNVSTGAGTLKLGGNVTYTNTAYACCWVYYNPGGSTISGNLDLGGAIRTFAVDDSTNTTQELTVSANILNGGIAKIGAGNLTLSGSNTYTLATSVTAGTLGIASSSALGGSTLTMSGATLDVISDTGLTLSNSVTLAGSSTVKSSRATSGAGVTNTLGALSIGTFTLTGAAGSNVTSGTAGLNFGATTITGNPTFAPGTNFQFSLGALSDGGSVARTITSNGLGTLLLNSAASSWALADTLVVNNGTVRLGASNALGTGSTTALTVAAQTAGATALFDLNGYDQGIVSMTLCSACGTASNNNVSTGTGTLTLGGNISYINSNTGWPYYYPYSPGGSTISGNLNLGGGNRTLSIDSSGSASTGLTISAVISNGSLTKAGAGSLYLSANNTYSGGTTISAGTLQLTNVNQIGSGTLALGGGTLDLIGDTPLTISNNVTLTGSSTIIADRATAGASVTHTITTYSPGTFTLTGSAGANVTSGTAEVDFTNITPTGNPTFAPAANFQFGLGTLSDGGVARTITQSGLGKSILQVASPNWNTTGDALTINGGTVQLNANNALGTGTTTAVTVGALTAGTTALFDLNGYNQGIASLLFQGFTSTINNVSTGTGTLTLGGNVTYNNFAYACCYYYYNPGNSIISGNLDLGGGNRTFSIGTSPGATLPLTVSAAISNGGITKTGAGTLYLTGSNTYSGGTTISGGVLEINSTSALGAAANTLTLGGGTFRPDTNISTISNPITISSSSTIADSTALTFSGTITETASSTLTLSNTALTKFSGGSVLLGSTTFTVGGAGNLQIDDVISGTGGTVGMGGTGTLYLTGNNTYTGGTSLGAGILEIGNNNALGTGTLSIANAATFEGDGLSAYTVPNGLSMVSAQLLGAGQSSTFAGSSALTFTGGFYSMCWWQCANTITNNATATIAFSSVSTASGLPSWANLIINGSGNTVIDSFVGAAYSGSALTMSGTGTLYLTGSNTYANGTTVSSGMLEVGDNGALGTGLLSLSGGAIEGDGTAYTLSNSVTIAASSTIAGSSSLTFSGAVTETANATLTNNNSALTLFSSNTFSLGSYTLTSAGSGITEISDVITGTGSITENSTTGGMLYLTGSNTYSGTTTVTAGTLEIGNNSALGTSTLSLNGGMIEADGTARSLSNNVTIAASSTITGASDLSFTGATTLAASSTLTSNSSGLTTFGPGSTFDLGTNDLTIDGSGNITISDGLAGSGSIYQMGTGTLSIPNAGMPVLTVTADFQSIVYGTSPSTTLVSYSGFVNGDTVANLTAQATVSNTASSSNVGTYSGALVPSGAVDSNYLIVYQRGNLTITKAPLTVTANNQSILYGASAATTGVTYSGFVNGDTASSLTTAPHITNTSAGANVGAYSGALVPSGAVAGNYTFTYVNGDVTITPAPLTIAASNKTITYGASVPAGTLSYTGLVNGDTAASLTTAPTVSSVRSGVQNAGTYASNYTASGAVDSNYTITYVAGNLIVNPASLTITANSQTISSGTTVPAGTVSYSGFVNGDTAASLTTAPTVSSAQSGTPAVGTYTGNYTASGAAGSNYTITYVAGDLIVNGTLPVLTITATYQSIVYGTSPSTTLVSYSGFINGDTAASLTTAPTVANTAPSSNVGAYTGVLVPSGAASSNYTIVYQNGDLAITPAALLIAARSLSVVYGTAPSTTQVDYTGFVNGDTAASLTTAPHVTNTAPSFNVGTYNSALVPSGAASSNYNIAYQSGNLTVTPAALTITADDVSKTFGSAFIFTGHEFASSGLANGDTIGSVTLTSAGAAGSAAVQNYAIVPNAATGGTFDPLNYNISYANGALIVNPLYLPSTVLLASQNQTHYKVNNGSARIIGGLLQLDPQIIREFNLDYMLR